MTFPRSSSNRDCITRTIQTAPGKYHWRVFSAWVGAEHQKQWKGRVIKLRMGTFWWDVCWYPKPRNKVGVYSRLENLLGGTARVDGHVIDGNFGSGNYRMGSTLDNIRG